MPVPVHELADTEQYLAVLDGHPTVFPPGDGSPTATAAIVVLALIAERASGEPFHQLVGRRVCGRPGWSTPRSCDPTSLPGAPPRVSHGRRSERRTCSICRCGATATAGSTQPPRTCSALWSALFAGRIVSKGWVAEMVRPRSDVPQESMRYGLGLWLHPSSEIVELHGYDAGVSFRSRHDPASGTTYTVISNTPKGTWPIESLLVVWLVPDDGRLSPPEQRVEELHLGGSGLEDQARSITCARRRPRAPGAWARIPRPPR